MTMLRILVVADIHGDFETLEKFTESVKNESFDMVICPGDFTDMYSVPSDFSQGDVANLVIQKLLSLKKPLLCVPGNHDPYEIVDMFSDYNVNLHAKVKEARGMQFAGWGGAPTPFNTIFEPSDEETKEALDALAKKVKKGSFILVTHDPAKDTGVDKIASGGHVGSQVIRDFIERTEPLLAISAHIHESGAVDRIGSTTIFYPGALFEGHYGIAEIDGKKVKCERRNFMTGPGSQGKGEKTGEKAVQ